jgi:hypothetical protein
LRAAASIPRASAADAESVNPRHAAATASFLIIPVLLG